MLEEAVGHLLEPEPDVLEADLLGRREQRDGGEVVVDGADEPRQHRRVAHAGVEDAQGRRAGQERAELLRRALADDRLLVAGVDERQVLLPVVVEPERLGLRLLLGGGRHLSPSRRLPHHAQSGTSSSSTSASRVRSGSSRVGSCSRSSPSRLIQMLGRPSSAAGTMSWNWLWATWTWPGAVRAGALPGTPPSAVGGLVGADVRRDDPRVERHADRALGGLEEVAVACSTARRASSRGASPRPGRPRCRRTAATPAASARARRARDSGSVDAALGGELREDVRHDLAVARVGPLAPGRAARARGSGAGARRRTGRAAARAVSPMPASQSMSVP